MQIDSKSWQISFTIFEKSTYENFNPIYTVLAKNATLCYILALSIWSEKNVVNNAQYHGRETLELKPVPQDIYKNVLDVTRPRGHWESSWCILQVMYLATISLQFEQILTINICIIQTNVKIICWNAFCCPSTWGYNLKRKT